MRANSDAYDIHFRVAAAIDFTATPSILEASDEQLVAMQATIIFTEEMICQLFDTFPGASSKRIIWSTAAGDGLNGTHPIYTPIRSLAAPMTEDEVAERGTVYNIRSRKRQREAAQPELKTKRLRHAAREQRKRDRLYQDRTAHQQFLADSRAYKKVLLDWTTELGALRREPKSHQDAMSYAKAHRQNGGMFASKDRHLKPSLPMAEKGARPTGNRGRCA